MTEADAIKEAVDKALSEERALWATDAMVEHVRQRVLSLIVCAQKGERWEMYKCIKAKLAACEKELLECAKLLPQKGPGGGSGPDCPKGYHDVNGNCEIDPPDSN